MTLHNFNFVFFELSATKLALKNTFLLAVLAATVGSPTAETVVASVEVQPVAASVTVKKYVAAAVAVGVAVFWPFKIWPPPAVSQ